MEEARKSSLFERLIDLLQRGRLVFLAVFVLLILAVAGLLIRNQIEQARFAEAVKALETLDEVYAGWESASGDDKKAEALVKLQQEADKIAVTYPNTYYPQRAHYLIAKIEFDAGQFDKAELAFLDAVDSKKDSFFAGICLFNAAIAAEQANHLDKSQEYLKRLVKDYKSTTAQTPRALLALGRIAEKNNDFTKANEYYRQIVDDYGNESDWTKVARDRIILLKTQQKL
jgi:TolA-binding protein